MGTSAPEVEGLEVLEYEIGAAAVAWGKAIEVQEAVVEVGARGPKGVVCLECRNGRNQPRPDRVLGTTIDGKAKDPVSDCEVRLEVTRNENLREAGERVHRSSHASPRLLEAREKSSHRTKQRGM